MATQPRRRYTLEEYFELERNSEEKWEYWDGEVFCMSGASLAHNQITIHIISEADRQLRKRGCQVFGPDMRIKVPAYPVYRYPDVSALCGKPEIERVGGLDLLTNPVLIVEVLSPSSEAFDRGDKFTYYKSIPSFSEYLLVAQHRPHVSQFVQGEGGVWTFVEYNDVNEVVRCASVPCELPLAEVYRDVDFETAERGERQRGPGAGGTQTVQ
jgi:Uma2 family endonuclease